MAVKYYEKDNFNIKCKVEKCDNDEYEYDKCDYCEKCNKYCKHDKYDKYDKYDNDKKYYEPKKEVVFACGRVLSVTLPGNLTEPVLLPNPVPVASVDLDLSHLKNPCIKIDFSAIIGYREPDCDALRLVFQLSKICDRERRIPLQTYRFERDFNGVGLAETFDSFGFTFCECANGCADKNCTYVVEIIAAETEGVEFFSIDPKSISALAVSNC